MNCQNCGTRIDEGIVREVKVPVAICHKCGCEFETTIKGMYIDNILYENGELVHFYIIEPYSCPHCGGVFGGHEFYCSVQRAVDLEPVARSTHPNMEKCPA